MSTINWTRPLHAQNSGKPRAAPSSRSSKPPPLTSALLRNNGEPVTTGHHCLHRLLAVFNICFGTAPVAMPAPKNTQPSLAVAGLSAAYSVLDSLSVRYPTYLFHAFQVGRLTGASKRFLRVDSVLAENFNEIMKIMSSTPRRRHASRFSDLTASVIQGECSPPRTDYPVHTRIGSHVF